MPDSASFLRGDLHPQSLRRVGWFTNLFDGFGKNSEGLRGVERSPAVPVLRGVGREWDALFQVEDVGGRHSKPYQPPES